MKRRLNLLCTALLMLPIGSVQAADDATPVPSESGYTGQSLPYGKKVRIALVTPGNVGATWQSGTLVYSVEDSLVLRNTTPYGGREVQVAVPLASADRMQVRTGSKGHSLTGFIVGGSIGFAGGAAAGIGLSYMSILGESPDPGTGDVVGAAIGGGILGGFVLGCVGSLVGALVRTDKWEDVPLDHVQLGAVSQSDAGSALGLTLRFRVDP